MKKIKFSLFFLLSVFGLCAQSPILVLEAENADSIHSPARVKSGDGFSNAGVLAAPAEVVEDGAGEQDVLLEHHGDLVAEDVEVVIPDIHAAHADSAGLGVVQAGDELHQTGLCAAGAADDAQCLAGLDVKGDIVQDRLAGAVLVLEGDVVEADAAVLDFLHATTKYIIYGDGQIR